MAKPEKIREKSKKIRKKFWPKLWQTGTNGKQKKPPGEDSK
jgi:hypothetical protein